MNVCKYAYLLTVPALATVPKRYIQQVEPTVSLATLLPQGYEESSLSGHLDYIFGK